MRVSDWKMLVVEAVDLHNKGDSGRLDNIATYLDEVDRARQKLRDMGYGVTGTPILEQVRQVSEQ